MLTSIVAENRATKAFADRTLFYCLRLDEGEAAAAEYVKRAGATERKILTAQYIARLAAAGAGRRDALASSQEQLEEV